MDGNKFPSNSMKSKEERRKVEPVLTNVPDTLQQSNVKKFFGSFVASDAETVRNYVLSNVLIPRAKAMLLDAIKNSAEMMIMGPNGVSKGGTNYSREQYTRYYGNSNTQPRPQPQSTTYAPYNETIFDTEELAWDVIYKMLDYVEEYQTVSISEYLGWCNRAKDDEYTYQRYGWSKAAVSTARPEQIPDGRYVIKLPKPRFIG